MRGTLVRIDAYNRVTGQTVPVFVGSALNAATLGAGNYVWEPAMSRRPRLSMQLTDADMSGALMLGQGELAISTKMLKRVGVVADLEWVGAPITVYSGDGPSLARHRIEFVGRVTSGVPDPDTGILSVQMTVDSAIVEAQLLTLTYGGGGGLDGDVEIRGVNRPAGFGSPINVPPILINQVLAIYQVDGYGNLLSISGVYENLATFGPSVGDYPTYAALAAATIPAGRWATCIAQGLFRLGAPAVGTITCDPVCGFGLPGAMMVRWLTAHAGVPGARIRTSDFDALTTAVQAVVGSAPTVSFWTVDGGSVLDLCQRMAASCNASLLMMLNGTIGVARVSGGAEVLLLRRQGGTPQVTGWGSNDSPVPWWRMKMPAARAVYVNGPSEIDYEDELRDMGDYSPTETYRIGMIVRAANGARYLYQSTTPGSGVAPPDGNVRWAEPPYEDAPDATTIRYLGGQTLESLKPTDAGATKGAPAGTYVGGVLSEQLVTSIAQAVSDGYLDPSEKRDTKIAYDQMSAERDAMQVRYIALGSPGDITSARDTAFLRMQDLYNYMQSLSPGWQDYTTLTPITPNRATYEANWLTANAAVKAFAAAITGRKGDKGDPGASGYTLLSSNPSHQVPADPAGNVTSYAGAGTTFKILYGTADVTGDFDAQIAPGGNPQGLNFPGTYPTYAVVDGFDANEDVATFTFRLTGKAGTPHAGLPLDSVFSLSKSKAPMNGVSPALISVSATPATIAYDGANTVLPGQSITFKAVRQNTNATPAWRFRNSAGTTIINAGSAADFVAQAGSVYWESPDVDTLILKTAGVPVIMADHGGSTGTFSVSAAVVAGQWDDQPIQKIRNGANAPSISLSASSNTAKFDSAGNIVSGSIFYRTTVANMPAGSEVIIAVHRPDGSLITEGTPAQLVAASSAVWGSTDALSLEYKPAGQVDGLKNIANPLEFRARISGTAARSSQSLSILRDGDAAPAFNSVSRGNATFVGGTIRKIGGSVGWDSDVFSTVGYLNGAVASGRFAAGRAMIGLNADPGTNASHETIDFAIFGVADVGIVQIYRGPDYLGDYGSYNASDVLGVRYTGQFVEWFRNSEILLREDWGPGRTLYFDSSLLDPGVVINDVSFSALSGATAGTFTLVPGSKSTSVGPNSITPTVWLDWGGNFAYSREAFLGGAVVTFDVPAHIGAGIMIGLDQGNDGQAGGAGYEHVTFGWHRTSAPSALTYAYINGTKVGDGPAMPGAGKGRVDFDGRYVRWYTGDTLIFTFDWLGPAGNPYDPTHQLSLRAAFQGIEKPTNIAFSGRGSTGKDGQAGGSFNVSRKSITLLADYTGTIKPGQLPIGTTVSYYRGDQNLTASTSVTLTASSTNIQAIYTGGALGVIQLNQANSDGTLTVVGTYGGVEVGREVIEIRRQVDAAPPDRATGASTSIAMAVSSASYGSDFSQVVTLKAGSTGSFDIAGFVTASVDQASGQTRVITMGYVVYYRLKGSGAGGWGQAGGENSVSASASGYISETPDADNGYADVTGGISGLTVGVEYDFALGGRKQSGNAPQGYLNGNLEVTTS